MGSDVILVIVVATALAFDFTNGFHDTANAIATSVSTRAMSPRTAVMMSAVLNFAGAFISLKVAATVGSGIVDAGAVDTTVVFAGLIGAIAWNLATWWFGLPSSSSHALIGGLIGAAFASDGASAINGDGIVESVLVPAAVAPVLAFVVAGAAIITIYRMVGRLRPGPVNRGYRLGQIVSGGMFSLAHGTNDAQKTMGIITLALIAHGDLPADRFDVPVWVIVSSAAAIALGTYTGGWRIIRTMGSRHQDGSGAGLRRPGRRRGGRADRVAPRLPAVDDARDLGRRDGRRRGEAAVRRALGSGGQHRDRVGAHAPRRRPHRRARVRLQLGVRVGRARAADHRRRARRRARGDIRPAPRPAARRGGRGMIAAIDVGKLVELVWAAALAGVAVAVCFSVVIIGATRAGECRRNRRSGSATAYAALSAVAGAAFLGIVIFGISVITTK
jgi:hypothetical protein